MSVALLLMLYCCDCFDRTDKRNHYPEKIFPVDLAKININFNNLCGDQIYDNLLISHLYNFKKYL